jgi:hypothetical protein
MVWSRTAGMVCNLRTVMVQNLNMCGSGDERVDVGQPQATALLCDEAGALQFPHVLAHAVLTRLEVGG